MSRKYIIGLLLIATFTFFSQMFVQTFLKNQEKDARIINIAGRQRMLSQSIVKNILLIDKARCLNEFLKRQKELKASRELWINSHKDLQNSIKLSLPKTNLSTETTYLYQEIKPQYQKIKAIITKILSLNYQENRSIAIEWIQELLKAENIFLELMNQIVSQYEKEAKAKVERLSLIERILMFITFFMLFLEAIFIFRPMIKKIKANIKSIKPDKENLENELLSEIKLQNMRLLEQRNEIAIVNTKLQVNQEVLKKSRLKLKKSLEKNTLYLQKIEAQKAQLENNNKRLEANQEILKKSLEKNHIYLDEIQTQKTQLEENNKKLKINQDILKKSHLKLKKSLEKNHTYLNEIEKQKEELQEKHLELQAIEEELRQSNDFLEDNVRERTQEIETLNQILEQDLNKVSKDLLIKNKKLEEYAYYNSHYTRAPLVSLLGLISILDTDSIASETNFVLQKIVDSAKELDRITKEMNFILEEGNLLDHME